MEVQSVGTIPNGPEAVNCMWCTRHSVAQCVVVFLRPIEYKKL